MTPKIDANHLYSSYLSKKTPKRAKVKRVPHSLTHPRDKLMGMKPNHSRKNYGVLPLAPAFVAALQLEFAFVEAPAPRARFLNFPCIDEAPVARRSSPLRRRVRALAA